MVERYLADTGVFVRWFIEQDGYEDAVRFQEAHFDGSVELQTVDFVRYELGHVLRTKGVLKDRISLKDFVAAARSLDDLGLQIHICGPDILERAAQIAGSRMMRFFDALLVAWSVELGLTILTTDKNLTSAAAGLARTRLLAGVSP